MQVRYHRITRYPAFTTSKSGQTGLLIVGYRPYEALVGTLQKVAPVRQLQDAAEYRKFWGGAIPREVEEAQSAGGQRQPEPGLNKSPI